MTAPIVLCAVDPGRQGGAVRVEVGHGRPRVVGWAAWHPLTVGWRVSVGGPLGAASGPAATLGSVAWRIGTLARRIGTLAETMERADPASCCAAAAVAVEGLYIALRQTADGASPGDILPLAEAAGALIGAVEAACDRPALRPKPSEWRRAAWGRWGRTTEEAKAAALRYAPLLLDWGPVAASLEAAPLVACEREGIAEAAGIALWLARQVGPVAGAPPVAARQRGSAADPLGFDPDATGAR